MGGGRIEEGGRGEDRRWDGREKDTCSFLQHMITETIRCHDGMLSLVVHSWWWMKQSA